MTVKVCTGGGMSRQRRWLVLEVLTVLTAATTAAGAAQVSTAGMCAAVVMVHGRATPERKAVLQQLCETGRQHATPSTTATDKKGQLGLIYLHRDEFSSQVKWTSGDANNVVLEGGWRVDEQVVLANGYRWYRYGLPAWPLLNQTLAAKRRWPHSRKQPDWPNYALATPLYLVPQEKTNFRDPLIGIEKLFAGDTAPNQPKIDFVKPNEFKKFVTEQYESRQEELVSHVGRYQNWLELLLRHSLRPMIASFKARQAARVSKASSSATCPDELYMFFLQPPCPEGSCLLLEELQLALRVSDCRDTSLVVAHAADPPTRH